MEIKKSHIIDRPLDDVYLLVRDRLQEIVPYLPNIRKIEVLSHQHKNNNQQTETLNHWYAQVEIPSIAQKFIKEELFAWKDKAIWDNQNYHVNYELESFWGKDLYKAIGRNSFKKVSENQTELTVSCQVTIHPDKVPGVPKFLVSKVLPTVEEMIKKILEPNLSQLGVGLNKYYAAHK